MKRWIFFFFVFLLRMKKGSNYLFIIKQSGSLTSISINSIAFWLCFNDVCFSFSINFPHTVIEINAYRIYFAVHFYWTVNCFLFLPFFYREFRLLCCCFSYANEGEKNLTKKRKRKNTAFCSFHLFMLDGSASFTIFFSFYLLLHFHLRLDS